MVKAGDRVIVVTYGGAVLFGKVIAADDKNITLKLRGRRVATINLDTVKELWVLGEAEEVK
jgi:preprotein translocase subunit YajC